MREGRDEEVEAAREGVREASLQVAADVHLEPCVGAVAEIGPARERHERKGAAGARTSVDDGPRSDRDVDEPGDNGIRILGTTFAMGAAPAALGDAAVIDSLSKWIKSTLAPISDADPAVLGKYVLALLKKDEPLAVLRANCARELADFLEDQTGGFVDALFARIDHEIERHDARAAAAADTGGTAEEDEVDYGEGSSDSEESLDERPRGRREKEKDDAGVDDRRDERPGSGRSDDRREGRERRARDAREEPERRRGHRASGSRSPGRSRSASRDRGYRGAPRGARRPQDDWDRRGRTPRSPEGGRFDGRDRRPPPGPPPGPGPPRDRFAHIPPVSHRPEVAPPTYPTPLPEDAAREIPEPADGTVRSVFFMAPERARKHFGRFHRTDFAVKLYDFYSQFGVVEDVRPNHKRFYATVVFEDAESARRAVRYRRVLFWGKELQNVETRWALPDEEVERRREEKIKASAEERETAARRRTEEAEERERNRQKAVEALRVKREAARKLAAIEAEKRALKERLEAATARKAAHAHLAKKGNVAAAASKLERDARELRAKYEAMLAAKKRKAGTEGDEAKGNKRGKK